MVSTIKAIVIEIIIGFIIVILLGYKMSVSCRKFSEPESSEGIYAFLYKNI
jgi:hypothetical protein